MHQVHRVVFCGDWTPIEGLN